MIAGDTVSWIAQQASYVGLQHASGVAGQQGALGIAVVCFRAFGLSGLQNTGLMSRIFHMIQTVDDGNR